MADQKITQLSPDTTPSTDDLIVTVNDPSGTPANKKVTLADLATLIATTVAPAWSAFTPSSTGFSSTTLDTGAFVQIGKLVFIRYNVSGTSNATTLTFTLPVAAQAGDWFSIPRFRDAGALSGGGAAFLAAASSTCDLRKAGSGTAWTNSGTKEVTGLVFCYEADQKD